MIRAVEAPCRRTAAMKSAWRRLKRFGAGEPRDRRPRGQRDGDDGIGDAGSERGRETERQDEAGKG